MLVKIDFAQNISSKRNVLFYLKPLLKKLIAVMSLINLFFYVISLVWGFDLKTLLGFVIGFIYVVVCYIYVAYTVESAVDMTKKKAKRLMTVCYAVRYAGLFVLCFVAMEFKLFNVIGVIIPQFYPRMAFALIAVRERKTSKKN